MIKIVVLTAVLALAMQAPAKDKMAKVPVLFSLSRDTPIRILLQFILATSILKQQSEVLIMCLYSQPRELRIATQLLSG
jgi:hypothetical protein